MKKYMSFVLAIALIMGLAVPAMAAEDSVLTAAENIANEYTIEERLWDTVADYGWDSAYSIGSRPTDDTFSISVGATGYAFTARSEVAVDGSLSRLVVSVETSIWD